MTHEMNELVAAFGWNLTDLQRVTVNAMKSAFIPFDERLAIIETVIKPAYARIAGE
jgi:adenosine deaminase